MAEYKTPRFPADDMMYLLEEEGLVTTDESEARDSGMEKAFGVLTYAENNEIKNGMITAVFKDVATDVDPNPAYLRDEPVVQIILVAKSRHDYNNLRMLSYQIKEALLGREPYEVVLNEDTKNEIRYRYVGFFQQGDTYPLEDEERTWISVYMNFRVIREYDQGARRAL